MIVVFAGPSLPPSARAGLDGVTWAPPAAQGDIYRAARASPDAIVLLDGFFSWVPAVWHKEILWAMDRGMAVHGAASMGALRAAELEPFGMIGHGAVFEAFRDGLEDDDEVALLHAGPEDDYRPFSCPMVNIRATLAHAAATGQLTQAQAERLTAHAKALFYQARTWPAVLEALDDPAAADRFAIWLRGGGEVDQKRRDALAAVQSALAPSASRPQARDFHFEHTALWDELVSRAGVSAALPSPWGPRSEVISGPALRAALGGDGPRIADRAVLRFLVADRAETADLDVDIARLEAEVARFRARHRLHEPEALQAWLADNDLTARSFMELIYRNALTADFVERAQTAAAPHLLDELRAAGLYPAVRDRASAASDERAA